MLQFSCGADNTAFEELPKLLNNLKKIEDKYLNENPNFSLMKYNGDQWQQKTPLKCDLALRKFLPFRKLHEKTLDFSIKPVELEKSNFICIQVLKKFGLFVESQYSAIKFNTETGLFQINRPRNGQTQGVP